MGDLVVAVDCSTTASKAVVFDATGRAIALGRSPIHMSQPGPGRHEQDPENWWHATCEALRSALSDVDPERISGLCVTTQRETFVCVDDTGAPVYPGIVWMDSRARNIVAELGSPRVHELSGRPADNTPSLYKIAWLLRHQPDEMARVRWFGDVSALLHHRLTGRWASSHASADSMGLFDMTQLTWSAELLSMIGLDISALPEVIAPGAAIGSITAEAAAMTGLRAGTPVIAGAGDGQCAALGAGAQNPDALYLNMGTAVVCGLSATDYSWDVAYRTVAGADGHGYLLEAFTSSGTYLLNWFRDQFGAKVTAPGYAEGDVAAAAAALQPGADGLLALPYWNAAQTPYWDARARGALVGLTGGHGKPHIYRAILEGIGFEIKLQTDGLTAVGPPIEHVFVTGGGSRSSAWMQILSDILERPLTLCGEQETTALGAAMIAAVATGIHPSLNAASASMVRYGATITPGTADYRRLWPIYRELYPRLKESMHLLSDLS